MNDVFHNSSDRRQNHRLAIHHHSRLRLTLDGAEADAETIGGVTLTDISHEGLMAADAGQLIPGARIMLEVPLVGWRETEVLWIAGNRAGCRFMAPLNIEELRLAAASSDRLAKECPGFASQIAEVAGAEAADDAAPAKSADSPPGWQWPLLVLASLGVASFVSATWFLG
ncbi:PilZ domain-containing protein [Sphingomonas sp. SRS2]|uniref:PilZ domain-containing protein n=1 Tax=Sphingomonas sp. SRS2 TaxID=133190 RepID=UPI000695BA7C|nr:PilZ domain-containing protein [Sphingomonas sp. SRS2]